YFGPPDGVCYAGYPAGDGRVVVTNDLHACFGPAENSVLAGCRERDLLFRGFLLSSRRFLDWFLDEFVLCSCDLTRFRVAGNIKHLDHAFTIETVKTRLGGRDLRLPGSDDLAWTRFLLLTKIPCPCRSRSWRRFGSRFFLGCCRVFLLR